MKKCSALCIVREAQIKATTSCYDTPREGPKPRALTTSSGGEKVEQPELSCITGENAKWYRHF